MPDWKPEIAKRLSSLRLGPQREAEIVEELAQHLDDRYADAIASGASEAEAHRAALDELSDDELLASGLGRVERRPPPETAVLGASRGHVLVDVGRDIIFCLRTLRKNRAYTAVALITLALGIGANTAIYSLVHTVLLEPLPYTDADRLVFMAELSPEGRGRSGIAFPNLQDWRERAKTLDQIAAYQSQSYDLTGTEVPIRLQGRRVNWNLFQLLGTKPQLGRLFVEEDDRLGAPMTAVISDALWKARFGANPGVVGSTVRLSDQPCTIVGVLPPDFEFVRRDEIFTPLMPAVTEDSGFLDRGNHFSLYAVGRLAPGVKAEQAADEIRNIAGQLASEYPNTNSGNGAELMPFADVVVEGVRPALLVLLGAVGFVLLIACANVANLALVHAAERRREIAVRLALGAARGRIVRQLLSESVLVSLLGGAAGLAVGVALIRSLVAMAPAGIPRLDQAGLDSNVLLFTLGVSVAIGILFGLFPALQASRTDLMTAQKDAGRSTAGRAHERMRRALLVAEVAISLVLLAGAGLMLRSVVELANVDPGFDGDNVLTMRFNLGRSAYEPPLRRAFYRDCIERIEALPGVESAAMAFSLPIDGSNWNSIFIAADKPVPPRAELPSSAFTPVSEGYFETMGIRLLQGRGFTPADVDASPRVTVVNETLANRLWPGESPIGKRIKQGWPEDENPWRDVVGLVADVKMNGVDQNTPMQAYLPIQQEPMRSIAVVARTRGNPLSQGQAIESTIHSIDPEIVVYRIMTMDQLRGDALAQQRLTMALLGGFAILALLLAAVGIYGVMSYTVTQRTHDIGIRMALGARPADVLRLVVGQGAVVALAGVLIGLGAALALTRLMSGLLFGVGAADPPTYGVISVVLVVVAVIACYLPARRATKVDPVIALRSE